MDIVKAVILLTMTTVMILEVDTTTPETTPSFRLKFPVGSTKSYVEPLVTFWSPLDSLTICFRVRPSTLSNHTSNPIFSYAAQNKDNEILISFGPNGEPLVFWKSQQLTLQTSSGTSFVSSSSSSSSISGSSFVSSSGSTFGSSISGNSFLEGAWDHVCLRWSIKTNFNLKSRNGMDMHASATSSNTPIQPGGVIILGQQHQDKPGGGGFDPNKVFNGDLTDLHIWDYVLPDEAVRMFFCCDSTLEGNLISWNKLPMKVIEVEAHYKPKDARTYCLGSNGQCSISAVSVVPQSTEPQ